MVQESRVEKTLLNARVNLIFYFITLVLSFFSRRIFLAKLGDEFIGLTGSLSSLLSFLNLAELGIGTVVGYTLYRPIYERNIDKINEIVSVFGYLYRWVGVVIFIAALVLSAFFPLIYSDSAISCGVICFVFYSFIFSTLIGYFVNYRQTLLGADQRSYVITAYYKTAGVIKVLVQMAVAIHWGDYYLWAVIEFAYGISYAIILNWKIRRVYPWLKSDPRRGRLLRKNYPEIFVKVKQIFVHKISYVVNTQSSPLLIYAYTTLQTVAFYTNYTLIVSSLTILLTSVLGSTAAGIGNLIVEGNRKKILDVYWELTAIRFWVAGIFSFALYYLLPPFIELWVGPGYLLSDRVLILIIITLVLTVIRNVTDQYIEGHGLFADIWAPIAESVILIVVSIVCGRFWGIEGVLMGGITSILIIVYGWKPYYLFTNGLHEPVSNYILNFFRNIAVLGLCYFVADKLTRPLCSSIAGNESWLSWLLMATCVVLIFSSVSLVIMLAFVPGMRRFSMRIFKKSLIQR